MTEKLSSQESTNKPQVSLAKDADMVNLARKTGGRLSWRGEDPYLEWGAVHNGPSLDWRDYGDGKTLFLWRGEFGGSGMEEFGLVVGEGFAAFIHPREDDSKVMGELLYNGKVKWFEGPTSMYDSSFSEARDLGIKNFREKGLTLRD